MKQIEISVNKLTQATTHKWRVLIKFQSIPLLKLPLYLRAQQKRLKMLLDSHCKFPTKKWFSQIKNQSQNCQNSNWFKKTLTLMDLACKNYEISKMKPLEWFRKLGNWEASNKLNRRRVDPYRFRQTETHFWEWVTTFTPNLDQTHLWWPPCTSPCSRHSLFIIWLPKCIMLAKIPPLE